MKKGLIATISIIVVVIVSGCMILFINKKEPEINDISKPNNKEEITIPSEPETGKETEVEKPSEPQKPNTPEIIVTIDNGLGEGDDRYILVNGEIIASVAITEKIYDYKDYYVTIEKLDVSEMDILYENLIVVDKYSGDKKAYKLEKVEKNMGVCIEKFDKEKGLITIDTGITTYTFNMNTREMIEIPSEPDRKVVVTIDNGPGEGDDRLILVNGEIIARVFVAEKIYDYKDYYVTIERETKEDGMIVVYKNLIVVDKYSGEKKSYELEKIEENMGVSIDNFDKEKGLITINTGITKYVFDMNTRTMTEQN